jgi:RHS repeat-associated protein
MDPRPASLGAALLGGLVSLALTAVGIAPAAAAPGRSATQSVAVGGFGIGDALEAMIDERDGSVQLSAPVAELALAWDSRAVASGDLSGFGPGWNLGLTRVGVQGGITVYPASGGAYAADVTQPSGLAGYGVGDLRFEVTPGGVLAARADGAVGEVAYEYVLAELGGTVTYLDAVGRPVARVAARGARADWRWAEQGGPAAHLLAMVSADGVVTELEWDGEPGVVLVHPAANLPPADNETVRTWRVHLDGGRVDRIVDPAGGSLSVGYRAGLISRTHAPSGAVTELVWRAYDDRVPRIATLRTSDGDGAELSVRHWRPVDSELPSGWPRYGDEREVFFSRDQGFHYRTELADGATIVRSTYRSLHTLDTRDLVVSGGSGERLLRQHEYSYPGADGDPAELPDPHALPGNWSRPLRAELTHHGLNGDSRLVHTEYEIDALGRAVREVDVDGTVTETEYAPDEPGELRPPVGLAVRERVTGPDGSIVETRHTLDESRSAVIASETLGGDDPAALTVTGRTEFTVEADGFVSEQRVVPAGDPAQVPVMTRWQKSVDLTVGERVLTETTAVGTEAEATSSTTASLVHGGVIAEVDAVGNHSTARYDVLGRVTRRVDAAGRATSIAYEREASDGRNATVTTTPDGVTRTEQLDAIGRVTRLTDNLAGGVATPGHVRVAERREYPDPATVEVTDAWGATTIARQDVFGREVETVSSSGATTRTDYDDVANTVTTRVTPTGDPGDEETVTVERLDAAGRRIERTGSRADGGAVPHVTTGYDGLGRTLVTDDGRLRTRVEYDELGHAVRTFTGAATAGAGSGAGAGAGAGAGSGAEAAETLTERRFDGFGASLEKTLRADGESASAGERELDELGRVRSEVDPLGRESRFGYSPDGLLVRVEAGSGQTIAHTYDPATRQLVGTVTTSPVGADVRVEIERDALTDRPIAVFDPTDRADTEIRTRHDGFGNPLEVAYPDGRVIRIAYDEHGRRERTTDATGRTTFLTYDGAGRIVRAVQRAGDAHDAAVVAEVGYRYDAFGRVQELERGNGVITRNTFTSVSEIATETTTRGDEVLAAREYEYDPSGLLVQRVDRVRDDATGELAVTATVYRYDAFGRLVHSSVHDGETVDATVMTRTEYEVTVAGDIRSERIWTRDDASRAAGRPGTLDSAAGSIAVDPITREFEYSPLGELVAVTTDGSRATQEYDGAGNLVRTVDGTEYRYDAANRLVAEIRDGLQTDTSYWADGTRRGRSSETDAVTFYWDGDTLLTEAHRDPVGVGGTASYLVGAGRHARTIEPAAGVVPELAVGSAPETVYYGDDRHSNVTELTDGFGRVVVRYTYRDYGEASETAAEHDGAHVEPVPLRRNPFQYAGGYVEPDGRLWLSVRSYDPASKRFTTMDEADLLNGYHYADLNPIMMVDPGGRSSKWDWMIDATLFSVAFGSVVSIAASAFFTGGWSLTMLGIVGLFADTVTMATSVVRLDAAVRREVIDPTLETAMFWGEVATGVLGFAAAAHTAMNVPRAVRLQQAEASLIFAELASVTEYRSPLRTIREWVLRTDGQLTPDLIAGGNKLFSSARHSASTAGHAEHLRRLAGQGTTPAAQTIDSVAKGPALTRPILASGVVRRIGEQSNRATADLAKLNSRATQLSFDEFDWNRYARSKTVPTDWRYPPKTMFPPRHIDAAPAAQRAHPWDSEPPIHRQRRFE